MTTILEVYQEVTAQHVQQLANWMSTVESRYNEDGQTTSLVAEYKKHTTLDIWFFYYDDIRPNMGSIGGAIMDFFLRNYLPTGKPVVNSEVLQLKDVELITDGYIKDPKVE